MGVGVFKEIIFSDGTATPAEAITAKKGKARLLLDKPEEVLCVGGDASKKKHQLFLEKVSLYAEMEELAPVIAFYNNKDTGIEKALAAFETLTEADAKKTKKKINGNIGFRVELESLRIHLPVSELLQRD